MIFEPRAAVSRVIVVGLGGTGSQLARSLARILFDMERNGLHAPDVLFVDPDRVEEKNVGRQMFTGADCGQFKAELLARRFNSAMGLSIGWAGECFDAKRHQVGSGTLLIGCVDNHVAREALAAADPLAWVDCGNHADSGQVICGTDRDVIVVRRELFSALKHNPDRIEALPNAALVFPQLLEPPEEAVLAVAGNADASCAELIEAGVQHLLINDAIATAAASYIYRLLYRKPLQAFMTFVGLDAVRPVPITTENLELYTGGVS